MAVMHTLLAALPAAPAGGSAGRSAHRAAPDVFADEPELLSACLTQADDARWAERILHRARTALRRRPEYADLHYHAAQAARAAGRLGRAAALLDAALRINPQYCDALILAGRVALQRGDPRGALARLQAALDRGADYPDVHQLIGDAWRQERNRTQARQWHRRAGKLSNLAVRRRSPTGVMSDRRQTGATPHQFETGAAAPGASGEHDELST